MRAMRDGRWTVDGGWWTTRTTDAASNRPIEAEAAAQRGRGRVRAGDDFAGRHRAAPGVGRRHASVAKRRLEALAGPLQAQQPGAASSLREGLDERKEEAIGLCPPIYTESDTDRQVLASVLHLPKYVTKNRSQDWKQKIEQQELAQADPEVARSALELNDAGEELRRALHGLFRTRAAARGRLLKEPFDSRYFGGSSEEFRSSNDSEQQRSDYSNQGNDSKR